MFQSTYSYVYYYCSRASYTRICGDLQEALADVSRAIALDSQYAPAYSLRSKIRLQVIEEREDAEGHDDEGAGKF